MLDLPRPLGERDLSDRTVLVWADQGLGDNLQFCRYIPELAKFGSRIVFETYQPLYRLMKSLGGCRVIAAGTERPVADYQAAASSLAGLLWEQVGPAAKPKGYLGVGEELAAAWRDKLKRTSRRLNIGIACSGNPDKDAGFGVKRRAPLSAFAPLAEIANIFILQKELSPDDRHFRRRKTNMAFLGREIDDVMDTAAIVQNMDLVVTVDTALAHVSGSLGKTTFVLLQANTEWRWQSEGGWSVWYPTVRLFKQSARGDWSRPREAVVDAAARLRAAGSAPQAGPSG